ncbi:UNVERIFIED_CONTAM: hypothetical protein GTU68_030700 [Idotea baltica]|nr:hypothetical protein [Idotea baltica]
MVTHSGSVEGISVNPECAGLGCLDHWVGREFHDFLTIESREKYAERSKAMLNDPDMVPRSMQLNHVDNAVWEFPIRYTLHRVNARDSLLLLGRDMQPIAEIQQRLVAEQTARERDLQKIRSSETFFRVTLDASETPLLLVEPESGRIRDLNSAAATLLGSKVDTLSGGSFAQAFEGRSKSDLMESLRAAASAEEMKVLELVARRSGRQLTAFAQYFRAAGELHLLCRLALVDDTDPASPEVTQSLAALFAEASDAIVFLDSKGLIRDANEAFLILTDAAQIRDVKAKSIGEFLARGSVDLKLIVDTAMKKGRLRNYATQILSAVGTRANVDVSAVRLRRRGGDLGFGLIIRDVTPREVVETEAASSVMSEEAMRNVMDLVGTASLKTLVSATSDVVEKMCIETAVKLTGNNRVAASEMLGLSRQSLYVKLRKHGLLSSEPEAD